MLALPDPVAKFLYSSQIARRSPAYLLLDGSGNLLDWGGDLHRYGIENLFRGELIQSQIGLLNGMVPIDKGIHSTLQFVRFGSATADLHLFSSSEGTWVVFLDVSLEAEQVRAIQQKRYELQLASETRASDSAIEESSSGELNSLIETRSAELQKVLADMEKAVELLRRIVNRGPGS